MFIRCGNVIWVSRRMVWTKKTVSFQTWNSFRGCDYMCIYCVYLCTCIQYRESMGFYMPYTWWVWYLLLEGWSTRSAYCGYIHLFIFTDEALYDEHDVDNTTMTLFQQRMRSGVFGSKHCDFELREDLLQKWPHPSPKFFGSLAGSLFMLRCSCKMLGWSPPEWHYV